MKRSTVEIFAGALKRKPVNQVIVRELPGVASLEADLVIASKVRGPIDSNLESRAQALAEELFAIGHDEASTGILRVEYQDRWGDVSPAFDPYDDGLNDDFDEPELYDDEDDEDDEDDGGFSDRIDAHRRQLQCLDLSDDEIVEYLLGLGVDLRDAKGHPLRCTRLVAIQAECAAKGIIGRLPDREARSLTRFEESIEKDRDDFLRRKREKQKLNP